MNLTTFSLKNPYTVVSLALVVVVLGLFAFFRTPTDLFPESVPPQVAVITVRPGSDADDVADKITQVIEDELNTVSGLKRITSTSRDEVSAVNAEFFYSKSIGEAVQDVQNVIGRIRAQLPDDILEPRIYRITDATRPLVTMALSPKAQGTETLAQIRLLAENQIKRQILGLPGIADVDVFGAHRPEVRIRVFRDRLVANDVCIDEVIAALAAQNISAPAGTIYTKENEYLVKTAGEFQNLAQIRALPLRNTEHGLLRIGDLGEVTLGEREARSIYHGNGKPAVAVNVLRPEHGPTVEAIKNLKALLPGLRGRYPDIRFEIADDQEPIIDINVNGMRQSLIQAILLTVLVIFVFLADVRAALVVSVSIPLAFLTSLVVLWFSPYTLNMVTLSGLIISVGMVVDASIVVLENIYRHWREMEEPDPLRAAREGTGEIALAVTAGMFTTVIVLIPVMFTGGYTQQIMRPLNLMISSTMVASLVVALTVVPLMASRLLGRQKKKRNLLERFMSVTDRGVNLLARFYLAFLKLALRWRLVTLALAAALVVVTVKVVPPLIGGELMPPMDTGIVTLEFETPSDTAPPEVERILDRIDAMIYAQKGVQMVSSGVGSEPGEISFGGGGATAQTGKITVHLVDRKKRKGTIWEIEDRWREGLRGIPGIRSFRVSEYGATPLSTTRAPLDVILSGPDAVVLSRLAEDCLGALKGMPGLVDVRRSWYTDKTQYRVTVDPALARVYKITPSDVAQQLKAVVKGIPAASMRLSGYLDIPIRVQYAQGDIDDPQHLEEVYISTPLGQVPLRALARVTPAPTQPFITRERLENTIDVTGVNRIYTIAQVAAMARKRLAGVAPPAGYTIDVAGTAADMKTGQQEMGKALKIGFVLLYLLLISMFRSFRHPLTIMAAIPLAISGALWGLLAFDKPMCKPATMGMILLGGTIVDNSILLLDFILSARRRGIEKNEAILRSVRLRIRPILMTTVSTVVGLTPLVLELAVGLERMSPLGVVAAVGLLAGTFMTMIVIPVFYSTMDDLGGGAGRLARFLLRGSPAGG